jgi:hypothetical protein
MVDVTDLMGNNVTCDVVKSSASKMLVILSGGAKVQNQEGKTRLNLLVEIDGRQMTYSPNRESIRRIAAMHGKESQAWISKRCSLTTGMLNGREAVIATPLP